MLCTFRNKFITTNRSLRVEEGVFIQLTRLYSPETVHLKNDFFFFSVAS